MPVRLDDTEKSKIASKYHDKIVSKTYNEDSGSWDYHDDEGGVHKVYGNQNYQKSKPVNQTAKALGIQQ